MANQVSLMALPIVDQGQSIRNTRNDNYGADDIHNVGHWAEFNLATIQQRSVSDRRILNQPGRTSSSQWLRIYEFHPAVDRPYNSNFDVGTMAETVDNFIPDVAVFDTNLPTNTRPNRLPGDVKPSYKWSMGLRNHPTPSKRTEFKQVLSQVNFYMKQHHACYSFILTNRELVAVRRLDRNGNLQLSDSIPWTARGTASQPRLTVLLGLWYLCMLASRDQDAYLE
ncbi:hypothetical protein EMCG_00667 [[Emmonsia] crescens]|uniref:Fungal-type protein kinase domain-containing protein n=1 Tax=[Emmonsia] crescens TaxID=73230 RepID=A0A0G2J7F8_9EURO|nr:hypothetical protein EMCG_00667 [Emmonsia crescens UAMH 3008]